MYDEIVYIACTIRIPKQIEISSILNMKFIEFIFKILSTLHTHTYIHTTMTKQILELSPQTCILIFKDTNFWAKVSMSTEAGGIHRSQKNGTHEKKSYSKQLTSLCFDQVFDNFWCDTVSLTLIYHKESMYVMLQLMCNVIVYTVNHSIVQYYNWNKNVEWYPTRT